MFECLSRPTLFSYPHLRLLKLLSKALVVSLATFSAFIDALLRAFAA